MTTLTNSIEHLNINTPLPRPHPRPHPDPPPPTPTSPPTPSSPASKIPLSFQILLHKATCVLLEDKFRIVSALKTRAPSSLLSSTSFPDGFPHDQTPSFLRTCAASITDCEAKTLPKLGVEATLYYARVVQAYQSSGPPTSTPTSKNDDKPSSFHSTALTLLQRAHYLCTSQSFQHATSLLSAVSDLLALLQRERYEPITPDELAAIKRAMVSGRDGIATHSGHWYNCENGHPFAIGECGMPMEEARCPECGARIGGRNHQAVSGVERAVQMERE